jgi:hypothetical protein
MPAISLHGHRTVNHLGWLGVGPSENLKRPSRTSFTLADFSQGLSMVVIRQLSYVNDCPSNVLVNRIRLRHHKSNVQTVKPGITKYALSNVPTIYCLTKAICGNHVQIAVTTIDAIFGFEVICFPPTPRHIQPHLIDFSIPSHKTFLIDIS